MCKRFSHNKSLFSSCLEISDDSILGLIKSGNRTGGFSGIHLFNNHFIIKKKNNKKNQTTTAPMLLLLEQKNILK